MNEIDHDQVNREAVTDAELQQKIEEVRSFLLFNLRNPKDPLAVTLAMTYWVIQYLLLFNSDINSVLEMIRTEWEKQSNAKQFFQLQADGRPKPVVG